MQAHAYQKPVIHRLKNQTWLETPLLVLTKIKGGSEDKLQCVLSNFTLSVSIKLCGNKERSFMFTL